MLRSNCRILILSLLVILSMPNVSQSQRLKSMKAFTNTSFDPTASFTVESLAPDRSLAADA